MIRFDNHAFKGLDESLRHLHTCVMAMGEGIDQLMALLPESVSSGDATLFQRAKEIDKTVNAREVEIDSAVAAIINKYTVMGEDLRFTLAAVKISGTLERAADKAKNCIKRLGRMQQPIAPQLRDHLTSAISALSAMMPLSLSQLLAFDMAAANQLLAHGASVQQAYRATLLHVHAHHHAGDDETHGILVAKNLEQIADMAVEVMKISHHIHFATKFDKRAANQ